MRVRKTTLGTRILIGLAVGILLGLLWPGAARTFAPVGEVFLRLLKMLTVPLVLFSITAGVCKMGDVRRLRTVGLRFVFYIVVTSALCAFAGVLAGLATGIGSGTREFVDQSAAAAAPTYDFVANMVQWFPDNVFQALYNASMLQIIVFALFFGVALLALGERTRPLAALVDQASDVMLKITEFVMEFSPFGIASLVAVLVTTVSGATMKAVLSFVVVDNLLCLIILATLYPALVAFGARVGVMRFFRKVADPLLVALTTTSSAAALPVSMRTAQEKLGVPENIYGFTLPLGNTCGMNGFAAYIGLLGVFAYRLYGCPVTVPAIMQFVFLGVVISIGAAGVKGAGIVMSAVILETLGLPLGIVPVIAALWPAVDPAHTVVNNASDLTGTVVVARSLGALDEQVWK